VRRAEETKMRKGLKRNARERRDGDKCVKGIKDRKKVSERLRY
jgi:hypothetical protein